MPHISIKYSKNIEKDVNICGLLLDMHDFLARQEAITGTVKSRAIAFDHSCVGTEGAKGTFLHITLLLLAGRDIETKKQLSQPLIDLAIGVIRQTYPECAVTLEVHDMDRDSYIIA